MGLTDMGFFFEGGADVFTQKEVCANIQCFTS